MQEALTARLLAAPTVAAIFSDRINWGVRPQGDPLPGAVLQVIYPGRMYTQAGADGIGNPRLQVDVYAATAAQALAGARAIRDLLEIPAIVDGIDFSISVQDAERGPVTEDIGGGAEAQRYSMDFIVWFSPAA